MRVVDASVVLAWYVDEEGSGAAEPYHGMAFVAPALMWVELANALWKKVRRDSLDPLQAAEALAAAEADVQRIADSDSLPRAFEIACDLQHPVYDCVYIALAETLSTTLVTADRRLAEACEGTRYASLMELAQ